MKNIHFIILTYGLIFHFILLSCSSPYPDTVVEALAQSKTNREELEKVLEYYRREDKEKYEAACFLIENMPFHQSQNEMQLPSGHEMYFKKVDSLYNVFYGEMTVVQINKLNFVVPDSVCESLSEQYALLPEPIITGGVLDIEKVNAAFLIDNIETAFKIWRQSPLLKGMSFDEFKEFVLPYRTTNECLLYKRSELYNRYYPLLCQEGMGNIKTPIERFKAFTFRQKRISNNTKLTYNVGLYDLYLWTIEFDCHNLTTWTTDIFRACGIPAVYEFTPQWPDKESKHFWCVSPDSSGIYQPYTVPRNNLCEDWETSLKSVGKVYRRTFGVNKNSPYFLRGENEYVPEVFDIATIKDETFRYHQTITLKMPFPVGTSNKLAYLSYVTRSGVVPVAWGEINNEKKTVTFEQVPLSMIFILSYYEGNEIKTIGSPFFLESEGKLRKVFMPLTTNVNNSICSFEIKEDRLYDVQTKSVSPNIFLRILKSDENKSGEMILVRKYPTKQHLLELCEQMKGTFVLGTNDKLHCDTLCTLNDVLKPYLQDIELHNSKAYRYYILKAPEEKQLNIALMEFLGQKEHQRFCAVPMPLPRLAPIDRIKSLSDELWAIKDYHVLPSYLNAFDGDMETFVEAGSITVDFEKPVKIRKIRLAPRNANNGIVPGEHYSLSLFQHGSWVELDRMLASDYYLDFKNVPLGGFYLLKNLDKGKEELPFLYKDDKQVWIQIGNEEVKIQ